MTLEQIGSRVHPEDIPLLSEKMAGARSGGERPRLRDPAADARRLQSSTCTRSLTESGIGMAGWSIWGRFRTLRERRLSEEALGNARSELAHVARVTSLGVLTASIAHEVNQPLSGIITNASTCLRMLAADPPNVEGARETARRTIRDGNRASDVITRLRALLARRKPRRNRWTLNEAAREVIALSLSELQRNRVILRPEFADDLPLVDRRSRPASAGHPEPAPERLGRDERRRRSPQAVADQNRTRRRRSGAPHRARCGGRFRSSTADRLFEAFYTTKNDGMGIGLSVSRSIIESHHGRLWAAPNDWSGSHVFIFYSSRTRGGDGRTVIATRERLPERCGLSEFG